MAITYRIKCFQDNYYEIARRKASSDDPADQKLVESIQVRLQAGDHWAWCVVTVTAECQGFEGESLNLSGCSYEDESDFKTSDNYKDMCEEALDDLKQKLTNASIAEREVYLALNPIVEAAPEFHLTAKKDRYGWVTLSFASNHALYGENSILLQHDVDIASFEKSLSSDLRRDLDNGYDVEVGL